MQNSLIKIIILSITLISFQVANAETGNIDSVFKYAQVCHDVTCATPTPGILNFSPTTGTMVVVDTVTGLTGNIWGNELGWIDLNPTGEGVVFADVSTGRLSGKAWSQVSGWINFAPTGQQVTINPDNGEFSGWAWTGGPQGGWIKFDCNDTDTCVKVTSWGDSGPEDSYGQQKDVCPNISGFQFSIPSGYSVDPYGSCILLVDFCPNILGEQKSIPTGYVVNSTGACVLKSLDYCLNINGVQNTIPQGYTVSSSGQCIEIKGDACPDITGIQNNVGECTYTDVCSNLAGGQQAVPTGYKAIDNICMPSGTDICPNIADSQFILPQGYAVDSLGNCVPQSPDVCRNLAGTQETVPQGFYTRNGLCLFGDGSLEQDMETGSEKIVAFKFIPSGLHVPSDSKVLKSIVDKLGLESEGPYRVDVTSVTVGGLGILIFLYLVRLVFKLF